MPSESCVEELETLSAIFLDDIQVKDELPDGTIEISMVLFPATADDEEARYVTLTLDLSLSGEYPKVAPGIRFRNPRGLSDSMLEDLMKGMLARCEERLESQMLFELIDMVKEFLTRNNRPANECPICLFSFTEFDVFHRTKCFHHFHSSCLGSYLKNLSLSQSPEGGGEQLPKDKKELNCPVCRLSLEDEVDVEKLVQCPPPSEEHEGEAVTALKEWEEKKEELKRLYEKQKSQGGIIDLNEGKKLLIISSPEEREGGSDTAPAPPPEVPSVPPPPPPVQGNGKRGGGGSARGEQNGSRGKTEETQCNQQNGRVHHRKGRHHDHGRRFK